MRCYSKYEQDVILVVGPSKVGKSSLFEHSYTNLLDTELSSLNADPGVIPLIKINAPPGITNVEGYWKDFIKRSLCELQEKNMDRNSDYAKRFLLESKDGVSGVRRALEKTLYLRGTELILVDNAHYLLKPLPKVKPLDQLKVIKSIARQSKTKFVLFAPYDVLETIELADVKVVNFPRYRRDNKNDVGSFKQALEMIEHNLSVDSGELQVQWKYLMEVSVGCIGFLIGWIKNALIDSEINKSRKKSFIALLEGCVSSKTREKLIQEVEKGEALIKEYR